MMLPNNHSNSSIHLVGKNNNQTNENYESFENYDNNFDQNNNYDGNNYDNTNYENTNYDSNQSVAGGDRNSVSNWVERLSLSDISVGEILDIYKNDTDLLKHILAAKTEEDKRRGAEEIRRAEEARLQSKFIDLQLDQNRRSSILDDTSIGLPSNDWLPSSSTHRNSNSIDLLSPFLNNTPPSPSHLQPLSPYTLFEVPFADLNLSAPSSPEPQAPPPIMVEKITLVDNNNESSDTQLSNLPPPPPSFPNLQLNKERGSCKRTLSRTRSTRKPSIKVLAKKNRSQPKSEEVEEIAAQVKEELPLDHETVMEALRAKLKRSTQQQKEQKDLKEDIMSSMSPSGILLLDLKNPKRSFPVRQKATPRASVVRKPNSFISAHKPKEPL